MASRLLESAVKVPVRMFNSVRDWGFFAAVYLMDTKMPSLRPRLSAAHREQIRALIKPGDIILATSYSYPGWQLASYLAFRSKWAHCAFYLGKEKIVDAGTKSHVAELPLRVFLNAHDVAVLRPDYANEDEIEKVLGYARSCIGRPFNSTLDTADESRLYCSQLVARGLACMDNPIALPVNSIFGKKIISPGAFMSSCRIQLLWSTPQALPLSGALIQETQTPF